jgi:hypothetical protein
MSKHITDKPRARDDGARAKAYAKIEREAGDPAADPKVAAMRKQPRARDDGHRAAEYTKIERSED